MKDMVGIFSRFPGGRTTHRKTQSAVDGREASPANPQNTAAAEAAISLGLEATVEFQPVEHPVEPSDKDTPIPCLCRSRRFSTMEEYGRRESRRRLHKGGRNSSR